VEERQKQTPRKQRLTASRVCRLLIGKGVKVSASSVRRAVRQVRRELRDPLENAYVPLQFAPGIDAQVDFYESQVDDVLLGRIKTYTLLVRACYSGLSFAYVAPNQTQEALFEGLSQCFVFFGGVFHKLWFDNLPPVVKTVLRGRKRKVRERFAQFAAHYGFEAEFCAPAAGWEKGGVENEVKYSRHEVLSPIPTVQGREGVQRLYDAWMAVDALRTIAGRTSSIGAMWQHEVPQLLPLPAVRFDAAVVSVAKVSPRSWISLGTNYYSVPVRLVDDEVTVKISAEEVAVFDRFGEVARHKRCYGRHQMMLELEHYLPLLLRKHRALDRAIPMQRWLERHSQCFGDWLRVLRQRLGVIDGSKDFVQTLMLCAHHSVAAVTSAVQRALEHPQPSLAQVRFHLADDRERNAPPAPVFPYPGPQVKPVSAGSYSALCEVVEQGCQESRALVRIDPGATVEVDSTALPENPFAGTLQPAQWTFSAGSTASMLRMVAHG
jgi:transposase